MVLTLVLLAGCGSRARTLTAQQVIAALRAHGVPAGISEDLRGPVPPGAPFAGNKRRGVLLMIYGNFNVDAEVFDTAEHARAWMNFDANGESADLGGRAYLVDNVVVEALQRDMVQRVAQAVADLRKR
jgi:hypothetical protein